MPIFTGFVLYNIIFWFVLFTVLPLWQKPDEVVEEGNTASAPSNPYLLRKFLVTAGISAALWLVVYFLIKMDVIDFYQIAKQMSEEDNLK